MKHTIAQFEDDVTQWGECAGKFYVWFQDDRYIDCGIEAVALAEILGLSETFKNIFQKNNGVVAEDRKIKEYNFLTREDALSFVKEFDFCVKNVPFSVYKNALKRFNKQQEKQNIDY
jgi:hypothetical protein